MTDPATKPLLLDNRQWLISFMTEAELEQWALYDAPLLTHNKTDYLGMPGLQFS